MARKLCVYLHWGLALVVAACAPYAGNIDYRAGSAGKELSLLPQDSDGIIVIGLELVSSRGVHTVEFQSFDPRTRRLVPPSRGGRVIQLSRGGTLFHRSNSREKQDYRYLVQRIPAGRYYMTHVSWGPWGHTLMSSGSFAVDIRPGTVNYVGNVRFKTPLLIFQDVEIAGYTRDDGFVRKIMRLYKGVKAKIEDRQMEIVKLDCDLSRGIEACY